MKHLLAQPRHRRPHYVFLARRDRQRIAQGLGGGRSPDAVAAAERIAMHEVEALLRDRTFQELVACYRELAALAPAERTARLGLIATELLELALLSGDLRVAMFVRHEIGCGRDPGRRLVAAIEEVLARAALDDAGADRPPADLQHTPEPAALPTASAADERLFLPDPAPVTDRPRASARHEPFAFCAATLPDAAAARALAEREAGQVQRRLDATTEALGLRVLGEAERRGTAAAAVPTCPFPQHFALAAHGQPARAFAAARRLDDRRQAFREGARRAPAAPGRRDPVLPDTHPPPDRDGDPAGTADPLFMTSGNCRLSPRRQPTPIEQTDDDQRSGQYCADLT